MVDLDVQWLLLALPVAFAIGWTASRFDLRQLRRDARESPRAVFKGLNLLLNEQQDKAIDAFIEAVQNDPDTTELHFALGNLFRRRGEFERAVRVHQHLLGRGDLKTGDRDRAQLALAQDYTKAGLFDRAEEAWRALEGTPFDADARLALLSIHERSRDWHRASEVARHLDRAGGGSFASRIAHHECEICEEADAQGHADEAEAALQRARKAAPQAPRPLLLAGRRLMKAGRFAQAMSVWETLHERHPGTFLLVADDYAQAAIDAGEAAAARAVIESALAHLPAIELQQALARIDAATEASASEGEARTDAAETAGAGARTDARQPADAATAQRLLAHLQRQPTLTSALALLDALPAAGWSDEAREALRAALVRAARPLQRYRCAACGFEAQHYFWQCPGCLSWDSYPPQRVDAL